MARGHPPILINEFQAANNETIADDNGDFEDWIEIFNPGNETVRLAGHGLSDREGDYFRWVFPDTTIRPGEFMIVWASGKNRRTPGQPLHTSFRLASEGEPLRLTDVNGNRLDTVPPVRLTTDYSYGRKPDGSGNWVFFSEPTPGFSNTTSGVSRLLDPPLFSHDAGFHPGEFDLSLSLPAHQQDAHIYYTLDGSEPGPDNGYRLHVGENIPVRDRTEEPNDLSMIRTNNISEQDPLNDAWKPPIGQVFKGTVVRAVAWAPDAEPVRVATRSFFVGPALNDRYRLPVVSLATDRDHFFSEATGIYVPPNFWERTDAWERPVHFEFFESDGEPVLAQDAGVRIHGGTSRGRPIKSLRMYARRSYGESWFEYPLIAGAPVHRYKRFLLRNSGNDWDKAYFRDALMQRLMEHTSVETQYYQPAVVFLNGEYWGIHNIRMRYDHRYFETMYGLNRSDLVLLEGDAQRKEGTPQDRRDYLQIRELLDTDEVNHPQIWQVIRDRVDLDNLRDYKIANIYFRNTDWPGNNIDFWRKRTNGPVEDAPPGHDGRWRWLLYDTDFGFNLDYRYVQGYDVREQHNTLRFAVHGANTSWPNPDWSVQMLRGALRNTSFRHNFINRFADLLNTAFHPDRVVAEIDAMYDVLKPHMSEHINRWRGPETLSEWEDEVASMRDFARKRPDAQRQHITSHFHLPGTTDLTLDVNDSAGGYIRVNTIDIQSGKVGLSKEPWPWTGTYFRDVPITITAVPAEGYGFVRWIGVNNLSESLTFRIFDPQRSITAVFEPIDVSGEIDDTDPGQPADFRLHPPRPNPFNSRARVTVAVPEPGPLRVAVYTAVGRRVAVLKDETVSGGYLDLSIDATMWASGIYIIVAETGGRRLTVPFTLIK